MKEKNSYDRTYSTRVCIRFEDDLLKRMNDHIDNGDFKNKSALVKQAVKFILDIKKS